MAKLTERFFYNDISVITFPVNRSLSGLRFSIASILGNAGGGMWAGFMFACFLVILFLIFRRRLYAGLALFVLMATVEILFFATSLAYLPATIAISVMMSVLIYRFGLVATVTSMFVFFSISSTLFTLNLSAWYATGVFLTVFVILAMLFYGFRISMAGKRLFGDGPLTR